MWCSPAYRSPTAGFHFAQKPVLPVGVALYGLNLSLQQILKVGPAAIAADLFIVTSTIFTSNVSGDQTPPGPSNSGGGAVSIAGNPCDVAGTAPIADP